MVSGNVCGPYFGGQQFGLGDVGVVAKSSTRADEDPWVGLELSFPLGANNEMDGFGATFRPVKQNQEKGRLEVTKTYTIKASLTKT